MDEIETKIWEEIKLDESKKYTLTQKQRVFIKTSLHEFEKLYSTNIYDIYIDYVKSEKGLLDAIKQSINSYFTRKKYNTTLGDSEAESTGVFRGIVALWYVSKDEYNNNQEESLRKISEKIKATIDFFDVLNSSIRLFEKVVTRIAIRFQNSIELLSNHQEGIERLAKFLPRLCLFVFNKTSHHIFSQFKSEHDKIDFLLECIFKKSNLDDFNEVEKTFSEPLMLKTQANIDKWSVYELLLKSPVKTKSYIYIYNGKEKKNGFLFFPTQVCSEEEVKDIAHYSKLGL